MAMLRWNKNGQKKDTDSIHDGERFKLTVEPVLCCFTFASVLSFFSLTDLADKKVCMSHFDAESCNNPQDSPNVEEMRNVVQSAWYLTINLSLNILSILLSFFYGSLGDNVSRKLVIMLPIFGACISTFSHLIQAMYVETPAGYLLIGMITSSLSGGWVTCSMASFSYLSDITSGGSRFFRIVLAELSVWVALAAACLLSSVTMAYSSSHTLVLLVCLCIYVMTAIYTFCWVEDSPPSENLCGIKNGLVQELLRAQQTMMDMVHCITKNRSKNARYHMLLCLVILVTGTVGALGGILPYLHICKYTSTSDGTSLLVHGVLFCETLLVAVTVFGLERAMCINRTGSYGIGSLLMYHFVTTCTLMLAAFLVTTCNWLLYVVPVVPIAFSLWSVLVVTSKSLLSKLAETQELGRIFAAHGSLQVIGAVIGFALYTNFFPWNLSLWPGWSQIVGSCTLILSAVLTGVLALDLRRHGWHEDYRYSDDLRKFPPREMGYIPLPTEIQQPN